MNNKLKIAYCTVADPRDLKTWSGIPYFIMKSFSEIADIDVLGPLPNKWRLPIKIINKLMYFLFHKRNILNHIPLVSKEYAKQFKLKLKDTYYDFILGPACSEVLAYLETDIPIIYISDATFERMIDYYASYTNLTKWSKKWGVSIEKMAIKKASLTIFTSDWAADSAVNFYDCPLEKILNIPLGANIESPPLRNEVHLQRQRKFEKLKLLWVGVEWERKGGQIAYDAMVELNKRGYDTELTICGVTPPIHNPHKGLKIEGFLDKNNPEEYKRLQDIYMASNVFIMPTMQECAGIVFSEASSYGLPILTYDTGGISNYVNNEENGFRLPLSSSYHDFADLLEKFIDQHDLYLQMSTNSRIKFENELNWGVWMSAVKDRIELLQLNKKKIEQKSPKNLEKRRLYENIVSLTFLEASSYILPLITLPYLFRVLGPEKFGIIAFFQALNNYFLMVTEYGFNLTATKDVSLNRENKDILSRILIDVTFARILLALVVFIVMLFIVSFIDRFHSEQIIAFLFFGVVIGQIIFPQWIFQGMERMKYITILTVLSKLIFTILVFAFVREESQYYLVPLYTAIGFIFTGLLSMFVVVRSFGIKLKMPKISGILFQLKNGLQVFLSSVSISFYSTISVLILGFFASNEIVGYYSAASRLIDAAKRVIRPITSALFPYISKKISESQEAGIDVIRKTIKYVIPVMATLSILLFILGPLIIDIIYSTTSKEIINVFRILCWTPFVISFSAIFGLETLIPLGMKHEYSRTYYFAAIFGVSLFLIITPLYQHIGSAIAVLTVETFVSLYMYFLLRNKKIKLFRK